MSKIISKILPFAAAAIAVVASLTAFAEVRGAEQINADDRSYRDFEFTPSRKSGSSLSVSLAAPLSRKRVRAVTLHLKSGSCWYSADIGKYNDAFCAARKVRIPLSLFNPDGVPTDITKATVLRVSAWTNPGEKCEAIKLATADFANNARVAVVRSSASSAPNEVSFAGAMADRCGALLDKIGVEYDYISDNFDGMASNGSVLSPELIFIPYSPAISDKSVTSLRRFTRRGGKLVVFYNASESLGRILGVKPGPWSRTGGQAYTAAEIISTSYAGRRIPYFTTCSMPAHILATPTGEPAAKPLAVWISGYRRKTTLPAVTLSTSGAYFSYIPPHAYPAAADLTAYICSSLLSNFSTRRSATVQRSPRDVAMPNGSITAAWVNSSELPTENSWADAPRLKAIGLNTLFMHWQAADFHIRPEHMSTNQKADYLSVALKAGRDNGIALHAWVTCFSVDGVPDAVRAKYKSEGRLLKGNPNWLDPTLPKNHDLVITSLVKLAERGVHGIHLDYVRSEDAMPVTAATTSAITEFVRKASQAVRRVNPSIVVSAAVFPTPTAASHRNQDWPTWVKKGYVDFVSPMIYTESASDFKAQLSACLAVAPAAKLVPGIGTGADESQTDASTTLSEIAILKNEHCRGAAFFVFDDSLLEILEAKR